MQEVYLCLDHDAAGIEACGRLADILRENGYGKVYRALPELKDWNELLKSQHEHGLDAIPAAEHPKIEAMRALCRSLSLEQPDTIQPYKKLFYLYKQYREKHDTELLYEAAKTALFCASDQLWKASKPASVEKIAACVFRGYQPYRDHGSMQAHGKALAECLEKVRHEMSPSLHRPAAGGIGTAFSVSDTSLPDHPALPVKAIPGAKSHTENCGIRRNLDGRTAFHLASGGNFNLRQLRSALGTFQRHESQQHQEPPCRGWAAWDRAFCDPTGVKAQLPACSVHPKAVARGQTAADRARDYFRRKI
ncbi:MAG: toprim domain-containing protein, partial [Anaerotruncus sp.]|nr:toprim domain-containing protein [Anaerotruncus sp.]